MTDEEKENIEWKIDHYEYFIDAIEKRVKEFLKALFIVVSIILMIKYLYSSSSLGGIILLIAFCCGLVYSIIIFVMQSKKNHYKNMLK